MKLNLTEDQLNGVVNVIVNEIVSERFSSFKEIIEDNEMDNLFNSEQLQHLSDITLSIDKAFQDDEDEDEENDEETWTFWRDGTPEYDISSEDLESKIEEEVRDVFKGMMEKE